MAQLLSYFERGHQPLYMLFLVLVPGSSLAEICCPLIGVSLEPDAIMISPSKTVQRRIREVKRELIVCVNFSKLPA